MYPLKQNAAISILFWAGDISGVAVTGKTDGQWTKSISKGGTTGALSAMSVTVSECSKGWYAFTLSSSHSDTLGVLSMSFECSGVLQVNLQFRVHANLPDDLATSISALATSISSLSTAITNLNTKLGTPAGASVSADVAGVLSSVSAVSTKLGTPAGASVSADVAAVKSDTAGVATVNSKLGTPAGASVSADIAAIQTKLGTPAGASVSADIADIASGLDLTPVTDAIADVSSDLAAVKAVVDGTGADVQDLLDEAFGRWKVQGSQIILYRASAVNTPWKTFDLLDDSGSPSGVRVFERVPGV